MNTFFTAFNISTVQCNFTLVPINDLRVLGCYRYAYEIHACEVTVIPLHIPPPPAFSLSPIKFQCVKSTPNHISMCRSIWLSLMAAIIVTHIIQHLMLWDHKIVMNRIRPTEVISSQTSCSSYVSHETLAGCVDTLFLVLLRGDYRRCGNGNSSTLFDCIHQRLC